MKIALPEEWPRSTDEFGRWVQELERDPEFRDELEEARRKLREHLDEGAD